MKELNEKKLKISSQKFRVSEVCAFLGITPRILKHYEDTGVLAPEHAERNNYREYSAEDVIMIQLAERLKSTQFSQKEIGEYFSGELDIEKKYAELVKLKGIIDDLIDVIDVDRRNGAPQFSIEPEQSLLCFCKTYPASPSFLQQYLDSRDAYSAAISAGCVCDVGHTFINQYNDLLTFPTVDDFDAQIYKGKTYRICVPIIASPKTEPIDGTVETVTRKKSLTMTFALAGVPTTGLRGLMQEEVMKRRVMLTGKSWLVPETGPHKKTDNRTYTAIAGVEIE
ncbi:MAG: MerR family transcriptional regulator [Clostridiales bacterium]|nr:MerR family transcriptional regulator [Clostridiales bacterium]